MTTSCRYGLGARIAPALAVISFLVTVVAVTVGFGVPDAVSASFRVLNYLGTSVLFLAGLLGLVMSRANGPIAWPNPDQTYRRRNLFWAIALVFLCFDIWCMFSNRTVIIFVTLMLTLIAVARQVIRRDDAAWLVIVTTLVLLMAWSSHVLALHPEASRLDQLPVTRAAIVTFLDGHDPYQADFHDVTIWPFFYLPLQWMVYLPFHSAGIDFHWVNLASWALIIALFEFLRATNVIARCRVSLFYPVMASSPIFRAMDTEVVPMWLLLAVFLSAVSAPPDGDRECFSRASARHQPDHVAAIGGLMGAYWVRALPPRWVVLCGVVTVGVAMAVLGPFVLMSPDFSRSVFVTRPASAIAMWDTTQELISSVSLTSLLYTTGARDIRAPLQIGVLVLGAFSLLIRKPETTADFLFIGGVTFLAALALNGQILWYYYYPPLLMIAWSSLQPRCSNDLVRR